MIVLDTFLSHKNFVFTKMFKKALLVSLLSLAAQNVSADNEFTFNVPVVIQDLEYQSGNVRCTVLNNAGTTIGTGVNSFTGEQPPGIVTVNVSANRPRDATRYKCFLNLRISGDNLLIGQTGESSFRQRFNTTTGTQLRAATVLVSGTIQ
jgi:hypothetical protein